MPLRWIFRVFRPKNVEEAALFKLRFAMVYAFIGWNFCPVVLYMLYQKNLPGDQTEQRQTLLSRLSKNKDIHFIKVDQMTVVEDKIIPKSGETSELGPPEQKENA